MLAPLLSFLFFPMDVGFAFFPAVFPHLAGFLPWWCAGVLGSLASSGVFLVLV